MPPTRRRPWTAKEVRDTSDAYLAGSTVKALARRLGRSASAVTAQLCRCGVSRPRPDISAVREAANHGLPASDLAAHCGISERTAYRLLARVRGRGLSPAGRARLGSGAARLHREAAASLGWPEVSGRLCAAILSDLLAAGGWASPRSLPSYAGRARNGPSRALLHMERRGLVASRGSAAAREYRLAPHLAARRAS